MDNQEMEMWTKVISKATFFIFVIFIMAIIIWKLIGIELKIDLTKFDFKDFLFLIVALFSLVLSIAFYFKATETSNTFYDNTYKFTRDISEILGRIEAGFGEKLQHLDTGYTDLIGKLSPNKEKQETEKEIVKDKKKLDEIIKEKDKLISDLMEKAELQEHERDVFKKELGDRENRIANLMAHLSEMKESIEFQNKLDNIAVNKEIERIIKAILLHYIDKYGRENTTGQIYDGFVDIKNEIPKYVLDELFNNNLFDDNYRLTRKGIEAFKFVMRNIHIKPTPIRS